MRKAIFFDKDGTLIDDVPYNVDPARMRLARGAAEALGALHGAGFGLFVISNQSGVARGYFAEEALGAVADRMGDLFGSAGVPMGGFYYCPHHPEGSVPAYAVACGCRKPEPGLILRAAREHGIDRARSWFVGDILDDVEAGHRAGCRAALIDGRGGPGPGVGALRRPDLVAPDLSEAARRILEADDPA